MMNFLCFGDKNNQSILFIHGMASTAMLCYEPILKGSTILQRAGLNLVQASSLHIHSRNFFPFQTANEEKSGLWDC